MRFNQKRFRENLEREFIIYDIIVFGDFSSHPLSNELKQVLEDIYPPFQVLKIMMV